MRMPVLIGMLFLAPATLLGQPSTPSTTLDLGSLAASVDAFFPIEMNSRHIPGAVLIVVSKGTVIAARGYGFADLESRRSVDPERTIFHIASVSKIITTTAAVQLIEQGRLEPMKDVNTYLRRVRLAADPGGPITLHHLLTHTAGFEEKLIGIACHEPSEKQTLAGYLAQGMPPRFARPGEVISYSNHGMSLVALLVEEISGRGFADYVKDAILLPLGMHRSGFELAGDIARDLAVAYAFADGRYQRQSHECLQSLGAGGFATTGADIAKFMLAYLQLGEHSGARILRAESVRQMQARQFAPHEGTSGWAYGFWEDVRDGTRGLMHDGGGNGYRALMYLVPDAQLGFFLAYNLADRSPDGELLEVFRNWFLNRYLPTSPKGSDPTSTPMATNFAGHYRYIRRARTTVEKMISVVNTLHIEQEDDTTLTMTGVSRMPVTLYPIGPTLFRRSDNRGLVGFIDIEGNRPNRVILDGGGVRTYERISVFAAPAVQAAWLLSMVLAFAHAGLVRPVMAVARLKRLDSQRSQTLKNDVPSTRPNPLAWSTRLAGVASALNLLFVVAFPVAFIGDLSAGIPEFAFGLPATARALLWIPPLTALLAIATLIPVFQLWRDPQQRGWRRLVHTMICVALLSFVAFALYWRLLGPLTPAS